MKSLYPELESLFEQVDREFKHLNQIDRDRIKTLLTFSFDRGQR